MPDRFRFGASTFRDKRVRAGAGMAFELPLLLDVTVSRDSRCGSEVPASQTTDRKVSEMISRFGLPCLDRHVGPRDANRCSLSSDSDICPLFDATGKRVVVS